MFASYTLEGVGYIVAGTYLVAALVIQAVGIALILGSLVVTPLLHHGYHQALILAGVVVLGAATAAAVLRIGFPPHMPPAKRGPGTTARAGGNHPDPNKVAA